MAGSAGQRTLQIQHPNHHTPSFQFKQFRQCQITTWSAKAQVEVDGDCLLRWLPPSSAHPRQGLQGSQGQHLQEELRGRAWQVLVPEKKRHACSWISSAPGLGRKHAANTLSTRPSAIGPPRHKRGGSNGIHGPKARWTRGKGPLRAVSRKPFGESTSKMRTNTLVKGDG